MKTSVARRRLRRRLAAVLAALAASALIGALPPVGRAAATEKVLYTFCSQTGCDDGDFPQAGLIFDGAGNLYGTTRLGGRQAEGVVFELSPNGTRWKETVLYDFCRRVHCADGSEPVAGLVMDGAGNLFGTTTAGGNGFGVVFELSRTGSGWTETVLKSFCTLANCGDGSDPSAGLVPDGAGNLYGTASAGGKHSGGNAFEVRSSSGVISETALYNFCTRTGCSDGRTPAADLIFDASGNLFGTTGSGGKHGGGVAFALLRSGTGSKETVLYSFCARRNCTDGLSPLGGLVMDKLGNLYGTTGEGGKFAHGTAFEVAPTGTLAAETVLYDFCRRGNCADGSGPKGDLIMDGAGNLYGTASSGGAHGNGAVFSLSPASPSWKETVLYSFCVSTNCPDGALPQAGLVMDKAGNLYGTTSDGGSNGKDSGLVFEIAR